MSGFAYQSPKIAVAMARVFSNSFAPLLLGIMDAQPASLLFHHNSYIIVKDCVVRVYHFICINCAALLVSDKRPKAYSRHWF
jgi:hypothetical protein